MAKKETCPKCGKSDFAVAKDNSGKHYCQTKGCSAIWVPGLDQNMKRTDLVLKQALQEKVDLQNEITKLRAEVASLKAKYEPEALTEDEILS